MTFEHAMMEFIDKLKAEYGLNFMIKSIEVSEELHQRIEWEIIKKTLKPDIDVQSKPHGLKFFGPTEVIEIKKHEANKRTVSRIMNIDGQVYVTSTDGKAFVLQSRPEQWRSLPDLPQD